MIVLIMFCVRSAHLFLFLENASTSWQPVSVPGGAVKVWRPLLRVGPQKERWSKRLFINTSNGGTHRKPWTDSTLFYFIMFLFISCCNLENAWSKEVTRFEYIISLENEIKYSAFWNCVGLKKSANGCGCWPPVLLNNLFNFNTVFFTLLLNDFFFSLYDFKATSEDFNFFKISIPW